MAHSKKEIALANPCACAIRSVSSAMSNVQYAVLITDIVCTHCRNVLSRIADRAEPRLPGLLSAHPLAQCVRSVAAYLNQRSSYEMGRFQLAAKIQMHMINR